LLKRKDNILLLVIIYLLLVGIFSGTGAGVKKFAIFAGLSAIVLVSALIVRHYYLTDKNSLKQRIIAICISFVKLSVFAVVVEELTGFSLNYDTLIIFFVALSIFTLWEFLDLKVWEKGVLLLVLVAVLGVRAYEGAEPSTAYQLYRSELGDVNSYEEIQDLLMEDYREEFAPEDFQDLNPYLDPFHGQRFLRLYQPALLEFEDGQVVMLEVSSEDPDNELRFNNIELLPEKIGSYFRYYPLEIEREADYPQDREEGDKEIIKARGAFLSRASRYQQMEWYDKLISVFGETEVWDDLWGELEGLQAPEGPVRGAGTSKEGYLHFRFCRDWEVDEEVLDEIYARFRDKAEKHNIPDLPVVFEWVD